MTPARWLHATVLLAGPAAAITHDDMAEMLAKARAALVGAPATTVTLGRVLYSPQGIALGIPPTSALSPILAAAQAATREVTGTSAGTENSTRDGRRT